MSALSTEKLIKNLVTRFAIWDVPEDQMSADTSLMNDLGFDSVRIVELILAIEEEFDIALEEAELTMDIFETVGSLSEYLHRTVAGETDDRA